MRLLHPSRLRWSGRGNQKVGQIKLIMMIGGFCNIRGPDKSGRTRALSDFINDNGLDAGSKKKQSCLILL
jgi:hypothetical protein